MKDIPTLFSSRRYDGTECSKGCSPIRGTESAGDFHFDLHHADVLLGLIVGEGDSEVFDKAQHIFFEVAQTAKQIKSRTMGLLAARPFTFDERRLLLVELPAANDDRIIETKNPPFDAYSQNGCALRFGRGDGFAGFEQ